MVAFSFFLQGIACILMAYMKNIGTCVLFAVVWGISGGFGTISLQIVWPTYYGKGCLGKLNSLFATSGVIGSAIGPVAYGFAIDKVGDWNQILWCTVPVSMGTATLIWIFAR